MRALLLAALLTVTLPCANFAQGRGGHVQDGQMARIPAGSVIPLYGVRDEPVAVAAFELDRRPVTREEYLAFVRAVPKWRRSEVSRLFAAPGYLQDWQGDLAAGPDAADRPVTQVSWFAARAYCESQGKRLPTVEEWEYVARASETRRNASGDQEFTHRVLALLTGPGNRRLGDGFVNSFGVADLHGLVYEWTSNFRSVLVSDDSRRNGSQDRSAYCAAGVISSTDPTDYPAFLRYAYRAGLEANSTLGNLGFRCARS
jgi:formylglycine-generating enzyme